MDSQASVFSSEVGCELPSVRTGHLPLFTADVVMQLRLLIWSEEDERRPSSRRIRAPRMYDTQFEIVFNQLLITDDPRKAALCLSYDLRLR